MTYTIQQEVDNIRPYEILAAAILERAVFDIQELTVMGVIKDDKCVYSNAEWPKDLCGANKKIIGLRKPSEVIQLIHFFNECKFTALLNAIGLDDLDPDLVLETIFDEGKVCKIVLDRNERYANGTKNRRKAENYYADNADEYRAVPAS